MYADTRRRAKGAVFMNLSKFLPKKKNTQDLPVDSQADKPVDEEKKVAEELKARVEEENNKPEISVGPVKEPVVKVNRTLIAAAILVIAGATGLFVFNPFSSPDTQQETKAPDVKTNKPQQSSALADLEKAEADKSKNPMGQQKKNGQTVKDGSVRSSAGSRPQAEVRSSSASSGTARSSQLTEEEKEAAAERKAARTKAQREADAREAEDRAGARSDIFFNLSGKDAAKAKSDGSVSVNDYYNNTYGASQDEDYVQVVGNSSDRRRS